MPLKTDALEEPSLNLASMLDIVLLLLMFFMVGTQFKDDERQYDIKLPTVSDATSLSGQPDEIVVNIDSSGQVSANGKPQTLDELEAYLTAARQNFPGQTVILRGDAEGRYQVIMTVLASCKKAGIRNISLAHRPQFDGSASRQPDPGN